MPTRLDEPVISRLNSGARYLLVALCGALVTGCERHSPSLVQEPGAWFADITTTSGINFVHHAAPTNNYAIPAQMGSGVALFDFNQDGRLDIYLIQNAGPDSGQINRLYQQRADGTFVDASVGSGLDVAGFGMGVAIGDVNNDGRPDVLLTEYGAVRLFLNSESGKFTEQTSAGIDNPRWATSASFFDYDRDGWLDLVVGNYLDYDATQKCTDSKGAPEFCGPHGFPGLATRLFRNVGHGRFADTTIAAGLGNATGPALGVICADFNGDHWADIFLADDGRPNRLFINQRDGTFTDEAAIRGLAYCAMGQTAGNMGVAIADVDGNGRFDVAVTHLAEENHTLWMQEEPGHFYDRSGPRGLLETTWRGTGFGTVFGDFDNDGACDLAVVNGRVKRGPESAPRAAGTDSFWSPYAQRNQLFANDGKGKFRDISANQKAFCGRAAVGRGLACGDVDNDGSMDLVVSATGGPAQLFRNVSQSQGNWLSVRLLDPALGNRDAYGTEILVRASGHSWWRIVQPGFSYLSSNDPRIHIGLGNINYVDSIQVFWPDGSTESFSGYRANQFVILRKGEGTKP